MWTKGSIGYNWFQYMRMPANNGLCRGSAQLWRRPEEVRMPGHARNFLTKMLDPYRRIHA